MDLEKNAALRHQWERVRLLLCDVDGVLTNGTVTIGEGTEQKVFHIRDGLGLRFLQKEGIPIGWVSNRPSPATKTRADELQIDHLIQDKGPKREAVETLLKQTGLAWDDLCYVGDDVVDLAVMRRVGIAVAVADAIEEVRSTAHYVTEACGGRGAVREVVELILKAQGKWTALVKRYSE